MWVRACDVGLPRAQSETCCNSDFVSLEFSALSNQTLNANSAGSTFCGPSLIGVHLQAALLEREQYLTATNVKSTSPTTENWLRKLCTHSMNNNMSDEDKHDTNNINNK